MGILHKTVPFLSVTGSSGSPLTQLQFTSKVSAINNPTSLTTDTIDTTGANLVVIVVCDYPATIGAAGTLIDNKSNTPSLAVSRHSSNPRVSIYYLDSSKTFGTGHTFTWSTGAVVSYPVIYVYAFSGASSSPLRATNSNVTVANGVTSIATNSVSAGINGSAIITAFSALGNSFGTGTQPSISGGGFSISDQTAWTNSSLNKNIYAAVYKLNQLVAASSNPTHTLTATNSLGVSTCIAAFK